MAEIGIELRAICGAGAGGELALETRLGRRRRRPSHSFAGPSPSSPLPRHPPRKLGDRVGELLADGVQEVEVRQAVPGALEEETGTRARWSGRSLAGRPAGCRGKPRKTSPRQGRPQQQGLDRAGALDLELAFAGGVGHGLDPNSRGATSRGSGCGAPRRLSPCAAAPPPRPGGRRGRAPRGTRGPAGRRGRRRRPPPAPRTCPPSRRRCRCACARARPRG